MNNMCLQRFYREDCFLNYVTIISILCSRQNLQQQHVTINISSIIFSKHVSRAST